MSSPRISVREIAWVAGLLEGEGCFQNHPTQVTPRVVLSMSDRDTVERYAATVGATAKILIRNFATKKTAFVSTISGRLAVGWMMTIFPLMSKRRQSKIKEVVSKWREKPARPNRTF